MPGAVIGENAVIQYAIVGENAIVEDNVMVGSRPEDTENKDEWGVAVIGPGCRIEKGRIVKQLELVDAEEEGK